MAICLLWKETEFVINMNGDWRELIEISQSLLSSDVIHHVSHILSYIQFKKKWISITQFSIKILCWKWNTLKNIIVYCNITYSKLLILFSVIMMEHWNSCCQVHQVELSVNFIMVLYFQITRDLQSKFKHYYILFQK